MTTILKQGEPRVVLSTGQIQARVHDLGSQISQDYRGKTVTAISVLRDGFMFMADLVRAIGGDVVCYFVTADIQDISQGGTATREIFYTPEPEVRGAHVLLIEAILHSGVTTDFLVRNLLGRGAASVKTAVLLDRQAERRVALQPDYCGFVIDEPYVFGYGLGAPDLRRNLPYVAAMTVAGGAVR